MSTFEFRANDPVEGFCIARIEADTEREARAAVKELIFVRKLDVREVIAAVQAGRPITDAKTGNVIRELSAPGQEPQG